MDKYKTVAELLERPERWCAQAYARNSSGDFVSTTDKDACRWCLYGAVIYIYEHSSRIHRALRKLGEHMPKDAVCGTDNHDRAVEFNDSHSHAEVLALVQKADI